VCSRGCAAALPAAAVGPPQPARRGAPMGFWSPIELAAGPARPVLHRASFDFLRLGLFS
jgi:hypothetical protein